METWSGRALSELTERGRFADRHVGPASDDCRAMLDQLGVGTVEELLDAAVPEDIRQSKPLELPEAASEQKVLEELRGLAARNRELVSYIGLGYHGTVTPPVIQRNVLEDPGWYTAYTPYQSEISQGRLEALLVFQTMISDLTGKELVNASLLDEATAGAEAMAMSRRITDRDGEVFVVEPGCHPQTIAVVEARAEPIGLQVRVADPREQPVGEDVFGVLLQQPGTGGELHDDTELITELHERGVLVTVAADPLSLALVTPPGEQGADIVVGSAQRFGVPMAFGGPHAAFLATDEEHRRSVPGRIVGVSVDAAGRDAYRLALQTREQHIRRERATSNICTSQVLLAVVAAMYGVYHGPEGLERIAERVAVLTGVLADGLREAGVEVRNDSFFDTLTVRVPGRAEELADAAVDAGYNLRRVDGDTLGITLDETTDAGDVDRLLAVLGAGATFGALEPAASTGIPTDLRRDSTYLTDERFHRYHSETAMLRYLRRLSDRDVGLDRSMIPLGSCTMKLNAATEMQPVTWPGFASLHPLAPLDQAEGYLAMIRQLEDWLAEITGYHAVSLQPNAGSQGELAGLLAIRAYHRRRGEDDRVVCLIPESAHGTNAASATMAGLEVIVVACDDDGNIDVDHLEELLAERGDQLAALMVTYPSTHGVYETTIRRVCDLIHDHGGQVYLDGANLNALVGIARPGQFGADVSQLNLHKTFCIPHGGGGPGVGPVAVAEHLAPHLPSHPLRTEAGPTDGIGAISQAPWGSAGILPVSWAYVRMMGGGGLVRATEVAVLAANYVASRLADHYPVLYRGEDGTVAHECILDLRPVTDETGITNEDVAKRLIDYGIHAPTMSFPVPGTLMVEPTESEPKEELDRFCATMISIREEIDRVAAGQWPQDDNPLVNAPHTAEEIAGDWTHPYSREQAAYPAPELRADKYWPPVARIDNAYGDRNLMCTCPPLKADRSGAA